MSRGLSAALAATVAGLVCAAAVVPLTARQPEARPAPPAEFTKLCVRCHASDKVVEGRRYPSQWDQVIEQMVARGATGTEAEFDTVYTYLVEQFGRVEINKATAEEIAQVLHLEAPAAEAIVKGRPFADFAALSAVPGVPAAELEKKRDAIVF